jgi:hypothetical protein
MLTWAGTWISGPIAVSYIYQKKDPGPSGKSRWMARIKVRSGLETVSLRLDAPGNKRIAQARMEKLQAEVNAGEVGAESREWMGEASFARLSRMVSVTRSNLDQSSDGDKVDTWIKACEAYLKAWEPRDTKTPIVFSARTVNRTKKFRKESIHRIARWFTDNDVSFVRTSFTAAMIRYIKFRASMGIAPNTLWGSDYGMGMPWGDWMSKRGLCEKPDRELVREVMPRKAVVKVVLPTTTADTEAIKFFRDHRHRKVYKEGEGRGNVGLNQRKSARYLAAWSLVLCVRGFGCRPTEATALTWNTVDLEGGTVTVVDSKTLVERKAPIMFEWVRIGLEELKAIPRETDAVCCSTMGMPWSDDSGIYSAIRQICKEHGLPVYHLKQAQKLYIAQLTSLGLPPAVIARWTGHTLTVQERHYSEDNSFLPSARSDGYGEFGVLSTFGAEVIDHIGRFARGLI